MSLTIGVDVGGTKVAVGAVDEQGRIIDKLKHSTPSTSPEQTAHVVADAVTEMLGRHKADAVGIGAAGFVDPSRSSILFAPNLAWRHEPLKKVIEDRVGLPVVVENDANAAAWAETILGAGRGHQHVVLVAVGTGIGAGIVINGQLYRGQWGIAGEPGHYRVVPEGRPCGCGNRGCWEQYASGKALATEARELARRSPQAAARLLELGGGSAEGISGLGVTQAAREGDAAARRCYEIVGDWLGQGLAALAAILDPGCFVIGGGVSEAGDLLIGPARAAFADGLTGGPYRTGADIRLAQLGADAGVIGAADLARRSLNRGLQGRNSSPPPGSGHSASGHSASGHSASGHSASGHSGSGLRGSEHGSVVGSLAARGTVAEAQDHDSEPAHEGHNGQERRPARHGPADERGQDQVGGPAEQRRPGALGDRVEVRQRWRGRRDVVLVVVLWGRGRVGGGSGPAGRRHRGTDNARPVGPRFWPLAGPAVAVTGSRARAVARARVPVPVVRAFPC